MREVELEEENKRLRTELSAVEKELSVALSQLKIVSECASRFALELISTQAEIRQKKGEENA